MLQLTAPVTPGFPVMWWVWWFAVAIAAYAIFLVWLWRNARSYDDTSSQSGNIKHSNE